MFKRLFFWLLLATAVIGAVSAVRLVLDQRKSLPEAKLLAEPPRAPFASSIGARGLVESVDENVHISPALPALVAKVPVKVGDEVKTGDVLVEQDTREASAIIAAQEAEIAALTTQVKEAEVTLAEKRDMWTRVEKLIATKVASDEEKQKTLFAAQAAEAQLASMKARIAGAEAQLSRMKVQLDLLTIRAPRAGRILQVNTRAGEYADNKSRDPLILLGQVEKLQLRADVDEDNASRVAVNMTAVAYIKGRRDIKIPLTFVRIEPYILPKRSLTGESSERVDTRVLQIIYRFDRPEGASVYVGQQMDVFLDAGK
jgi:multidrug efflux pump subunit AcrA (membrane-fusion protein)